MADNDGDKFADLLELYDSVKKKNVWSRQDLDKLEVILGNSHPVDTSIRHMFQDAARISGYGTDTTAKLLRLSETIIQSLPGKIGRFNRELAPRYGALNRTTPSSQLRDTQPDYVEKRPGASVTRFYKAASDARIIKQARATHGPSVTVLQYHIPRGLRPRTQSSGQYIKTITNITDHATGTEFPLKILGIVEDVNRANSGHVIVSL